MYGGSGKLGRVGGGNNGRGGKRSSFPPPPAHRPSTPSAGRLSLGNSGGPRNRTSTTNSVPSARSGNTTLEENFSLVSGKDPPAFAMIVRLTPDLVDEISRVEAQGGAARIKFDPNANNTAGNVIGVGEKDFRFTWSSEMGDLCDIYEERQSGENGNGLLVESGCAWRKLNVQRILDESTTNHVKMRSEEAERKLKSRKAIVLDHGNPSMKSQMKAVAASETNSWRMPFTQKKEPTFKKRKFETSQVGAPPKPAVFKSGVTSTSAAKGRQSASPLQSPPDQSVAPASPIGIGIINKSHAIVEDIIPTPVISKEKMASYEKEIPSRAASTARGTPVSKGKIGAASVDLQSMLISVLRENPKGMGIKALEKAIGDTIPNSVKKIEPILKKIAIFLAPGRYILKPGIELESFKKPLSESGSSPEDNRHQIPAFEKNHDQTPASEPSIVEKILTNECQEETLLNSKLGEESTMLDKIDIQQQPPNLLGEKRASDNIGAQAGSSSNSGSDSDSESDSSDSESDSQSNSRSKSRSPVGSGSGSSSDSESDASSNSKEGSDEDVDIMTSDDDKEPKQKIEVSEPGLSKSPIPWRIDGVPVHHEIDERQDTHIFAAVEIERILPNDQETEISVHTKENEKPVKYTKPNSPSHDDYQERQNYIVSLFDEKEKLVKDGFRHEHSNSSERISKSKSKRGFDLKHSDGKSENAKRLKAGSLPQPPTSGIKNAQFLEGPHDSSPDRLSDDLCKGSNIHLIDRDDMVDTVDYDLQKGYNQEIPGKSISDFHQPGQRFIDHGGTAKAHDMAEKPGKRVESLTRGPKYSVKSSHVHESVPMQEDKAYREAQDEDTYTNENKVPKNIKESGFSARRSLPSDPQYKKRGELVGKFKEVGEISNLHMESSPKDNDGNGARRSPAVNGRSSILRRELSDLELGELREPMSEETRGVRKQFERKNSFKESESNVRTADTWNPDIIKGRPGGKAILDPGKLSPPSSSVGVSSNPEASSKKRTPEHFVEDKTRSQQRVTQSQPQHLTRADHVDVASHSSKLADVNSKFRQNESGTNQVIGLEGYRETYKKAPINELQAPDSRRGPQSKKANRVQPSIRVADLTNGQKEATLLENNNDVQKRRESSSDENSCSYSKYEKDDPELKGPIKDFSQYEEYVQEYRDKYDSYCSLDKTLETDRNHFRNLGKNLEFSKGRDMERYYNLLAQLKDSYHQYGPRHKRLKRIFLVLHEELKTLKQRIKDYAFQYTKV